MNAVKFTNISERPFSWAWGGVEYSFEPGETMMLEPHLATHFAEHLADDILNNTFVEKNGKKESLPTNHFSRESLIKKCIRETGVSAQDEVQLRQNIMNAQEEVPAVKEEVKPQEPISSKVSAPKPFCDSCDSRGVKHKKECSKNPAKVIETLPQA